MSKVPLLKEVKAEDEAEVEASRKGPRQQAASRAIDEYVYRLHAEHDKGKDMSSSVTATRLWGTVQSQVFM